MVWKARISSCIVSLLEWIKNLFMELWEKQGFWTFLLVYAIRKVLMVSVESQVPLVFSLHFLDIRFFCIMAIFAKHLFFLAFSQLKIQPRFKDVIVWPKVQVVFEFLDFSCIIYVFFAFWWDIRCNNLDLYPLKVFKVEGSFLFIVRSNHLLFAHQIMM